MLTNQDISRIISAMQNIFYTKQEMDQKFDEVSLKFSNLQSTVDGMAVKLNNVEHEQKITNHRLACIEEWIALAANKINLPFKR